MAIGRPMSAYSLRHGLCARRVGTLEITGAHGRTDFLGHDSRSKLYASTGNVSFWIIRGIHMLGHFNYGRRGLEMTGDSN
jgi:hypothetical protein